MLISMFRHRYPQEGATGNSFPLGLDFQQIIGRHHLKLGFNPIFFERHGVLRFLEGLVSEKSNLSAEMIHSGARVSMSRHRVLHSESW